MDTNQPNQNNQAQPLHVAPQPQYPISGPHKEMAPIEAPVSEYVAPAGHEVEPVLSPEVQEAGVETSPSIEAPQITDEHKKAGVVPPAQVTPVQVAQNPSAVPIPYTFTQVEEKFKETKSDESVHWLMKLYKFIFAREGVQA